MSATFFRLFTNSLRQSLLRHPVRSAYQVRHSTAMDTVIAENKNADIKVIPEIIPDKEKTRFKTRYVKRQWEDPNPKTVDGETDAKKSCERIKRKKMAMLLGYCGVNYYGMQRNPGVQTIEEELLKALFDAKYITEEDFDNQQNAQFQRSSRTDKGVSAARQVVSLKLPLEVNKEEINRRLPECIKVFSIKRVTNKFNSKSKCNARTYSYTLPTYALEANVATDEERKAYRITPEKLEEVNSVLGNYKGTKSYHNFTERKYHTDPSASRYMMGFSIEKVFVDSDYEFAVLLVKGQSFMLHQIRKMVGLTVAVVRGQTTSAIMERAFGKDKLIIPTAPGLGLVLDKVHYERYDARYKNSHDSLTWDDEEPAIHEFIHKHIYPIIIKGEIEGNSMGQWLEKLTVHSYEPSEETPDDQKDKEKIPDDDDDDECVADKSAGDESKSGDSDVSKVESGKESAAV